MSPKAHLVTGLLLAASVLLPSPARAANTGVGHGTIMISAERLFGFTSTRITQETGGGEVSADQTQFGLALAPFGQAPQIYTLPRLGFDFAVIDGLTLGGSLGFVVGGTGSSATAGGVTTDADGPSFTTFLIAPRIGYVLGLGRTLNLWLRGGFTYFNTAVHTDTSALPPNNTRTQTLWGLSLNLEPTLMIAPFDHVAFTASVLVDLPLAGKQSTERTNGSVTTTTSVDTSVRNLGLVAGVIVMF